MALIPMFLFCMCIVIGGSGPDFDDPRSESYTRGAWYRELQERRAIEQRQVRRKEIFAPRETKVKMKVFITYYAVAFIACLILSLVQSTG